MLKASCHCGAVRIEATRRTPTVTECNCSVCRRYGARWAYYTRKTARLVDGEHALIGYRWGDESIEFCHCKTCGCLTHYESTEKSEDSRFAINARMFSPEDIEGVRVRHFDGALSWKYLDD